MELKDINGYLRSIYNKKKVFGFVDGTLVSNDGMCCEIFYRSMRLIAQEFVDCDISLDFIHKQKYIYCEKIVNTQIPLGQSIISIPSVVKLSDGKAAVGAERKAAANLGQVTSECLVTMNPNSRLGAGLSEFVIDIDMKPGEIGVIAGISDGVSGNAILKYRGTKLHSDVDAWIFKDDEAIGIEKHEFVKKQMDITDGFRIMIPGFRLITKSSTIKRLEAVLGEAKTTERGEYIYWDLEVTNDWKLRVVEE